MMARWQPQTQLMVNYSIIQRLGESIFPAQKRTVSAAELPSTPTRMPKRRRYETPTREMLNRVHSIGSSPAVAVSTIHIPYKQ